MSPPPPHKNLKPQLLHLLTYIPASASYATLDHIVEYHKEPMIFVFLNATNERVLLMSLG